MRLFIAEKPSLARAIAEVLPPPHKRNGDSIECGEGNVVAWCAGHLLELAPPEDYAPEYKHWRLDPLPICPQEWKHQVSTPGLLQSIKTLLRTATRVVHAGDPDREGQLLVDEVLHYLGYTGPTDRLLINDLSPEAVRKALAAIESNDRFQPLSSSALARQRADWLYGLNMTRLYTLLGRAGGYDGVLSVGRVQTPLLGIIVGRDLEMENFRPKPYYLLLATMHTAEGATFRASWMPSEAHETMLDEERRLLSQETAESVRQRTAGQPGMVTSATQEKKAESPPLPYSLAEIQMDAARRLGLSAAKVLEACQSLYETHHLTTYPRSDCAYLPEGHRAQAREVLEAIGKHATGLAPLAAKADLSLRSRAWNDKKVTAHHAIIPTPNAARGAALQERERAVYELIARRYVMQFFPPFEYLQTRVEITVNGERFRASGRQVMTPGWKVLTDDKASEDEEAKEETEPDNASLPALQEGQALTAAEVAVLDKKTQPPKPFTDASIMQAMCNVARYVSDPKIKQILKETDGIGTPATRANIIETLFERKFVERKAKKILSTKTGRALIEKLPAVATSPDMTALWETALRRIHEGELSLDAFLDGVQRQLQTLITQGKALGSLQVAEAYACSQEGCSGHLRRLKGSKGFFWSCLVCRTPRKDAGGKPHQGQKAVSSATSGSRRSRKSA